MLQTWLGKLRAIGMVEAVSFLVLLGVAMPLKYLAGQPMAVKIVGWIHGVLFVAFCFILLRAMQEAGWPIGKAARVFIAALVPFGPFWIDRDLRREDEARRAAAEQ